MDKPDFLWNMREKDVFCSKVDYEFKTLQSELDNLQLEQVIDIADKAYMEGYLDGLHFVSYLYDSIT